MNETNAAIKMGESLSRPKWSCTQQTNCQCFTPPYQRYEPLKPNCYVLLQIFAYNAGDLTKSSDEIGQQRFSLLPITNYWCYIALSAVDISCNIRTNVIIPSHWPFLSLSPFSLFFCINERKVWARKVWVRPLEKFRIWRSLEHIFCHAHTRCYIVFLMDKPYSVI